MSSEAPIIVGTPATNGHANGTANGAAPTISRNGGSVRGETSNVGTFGVKSGLAQMLKGGVIMVRDHPFGNE